MTRLRSMLLAVTAAVLTACSGDTTLPPADAEYVGTLAEFLEAPALPGSPVRVLLRREGTAAPEDLAIVHVGPQTVVHIQQRDGRVRHATTADLTAYDQLYVWTTGAELRSYPVQVFAERIYIVR